jgi:hypothetical protein
MQALPTLYSQIGDVFAYACIIALTVVTILGLLHIERVKVVSPRTA